ncbi:MAG: YihY/virulence factor BrkB family protein [Clostridia bacterium]|nr:YihY/virulence factor BrkB family protein [Clostridia bacterium]
MGRVRRAYQYLKGKYELLHVKKYTTIAGTLVFFLIMSIMPFAFWLSLIIGKLPIDTEKLFSLPVFESVKNVLEYVQTEAREATAGASVVLLVTTLYSSTNLFYQMRRSGEIVYDVYRKKQGLKTRIAALALLGFVLVLAVAFLLVFALGTFVFSRWFPRGVELLIDHVLLAILAFFLALLLNVYVCPYKRKWRLFLSGTCVTVGLWAVAALGFSIYLKIGNLTKLYGALTTVIVFLLWLYVMMIGFIVGVIFNSERVIKKRKR